METLIISSIIALLVIAGVALLVARWMKFCDEFESFNREVARINKELQLRQDEYDQKQQERLILEAKEILKQKQP